MSILLNGFVIGWSVAWPPGPVNAEIIRRGLRPRGEGGGFWGTWRVGLGACTGDFLWALAVATGAGALLNEPGIKFVLGIASFALLLVLAAIFLRAAWKAWRRSNDTELPGISATGRRGGYWLGFFFVLSSPWNIGFWLAVIGSQQSLLTAPSLSNSLMMACSVVLGALTWTVVLAGAVTAGARIFTKPSWQVWTEIVSAGVMVYFALKLAFQLFK